MKGEDIISLCKVNLRRKVYNYQRNRTELEKKYISYRGSLDVSLFEIFLLIYCQELGSISDQKE